MTLVWAHDGTSIIWWMYFVTIWWMYLSLFVTSTDNCRLYPGSVLGKDDTHWGDRGICLNKPHLQDIDKVLDIKPSPVWTLCFSLVGTQGGVKKPGQLCFMTLHDTPWGIWGSNVCHQVERSWCLSHRLLLGSLCRVPPFLSHDNTIFLLSGKNGNM